MSEHKKLARLVAGAFYRHSSTRDRLARVGNASTTTRAPPRFSSTRSRDARGSRRTIWLALVLLSSKQVRKALPTSRSSASCRAHVEEDEAEGRAGAARRRRGGGHHRGLSAPSKRSSRTSAWTTAASSTRCSSGSPPRTRTSSTGGERTGRRAVQVHERELRQAVLQPPAVSAALPAGMFSARCAKGGGPAGRRRNGAPRNPGPRRG